MKLNGNLVRGKEDMLKQVQATDLVGFVHDMEESMRGADDLKMSFSKNFRRI